MVEMTGDWKILEENGHTIIKVIDFPSDGTFGGESMWVEIVEGSDSKGVGTLRNTAIFSDLEFGDRVRYSGGTDMEKPKYAGRA